MNLLFYKNTWEYFHYIQETIFTIFSFCMLTLDSDATNPSSPKSSIKRRCGCVVVGPYQNKLCANLKLIVAENFTEILK